MPNPLHTSILPYAPSIRSSSAVPVGCAPHTTAPLRRLMRCTSQRQSLTRASTPCVGGPRQRSPGRAATKIAALPIWMCTACSTVPAARSTPALPRRSLFARASADTGCLHTARRRRQGVTPAVERSRVVPARHAWHAAQSTHSPGTLRLHTAVHGAVRGVAPAVERSRTPSLSATSAAPGAVRHPRRPC